MRYFILKTIFASILILLASTKAQAETVNFEVRDYSFQQSFVEHTDIASATNSYGNPSNDVHYRFTINRPTVFLAHHAYSKLTGTSMYLLKKESGGSESVYKEIWSADNNSQITPSNPLLQEIQTIYWPLPVELDSLQRRQAGICMLLEMGEYELVCEGQTMTNISNNGEIHTSFYFLQAGGSKEHAIDVGTQSCSFTYESLGYYNIGYTSKLHIYHKIRIETTMILYVETFCLSSISVQLFDEQGNYFDLDFKEGHCELLLKKGTYYVYWGTHDKNVWIDIKITLLSMQLGNCPDSPILIEQSDKTGKIDYGSTLDMSQYTDNYPERPANDVFFALHLTDSIIGSIAITPFTFTEGIRMSLLNEKQEEVQHYNIAGDTIIKFRLPLGFHYLVCEGNRENGEFGITISGQLPPREQKEDYTPSTDMNYIRTITPRTSSDTPDAFFFLSKAKHNICYYDHLGRPVQKIAYKDSPTGQDQILHYEYDGLGRNGKEWLPINRAEQIAGIYTPLNTVRMLSGKQYADTAAFNFPVFENSSLNRIIERYGPGEEWQNSGHSQKTRYFINFTSDECRYFYVGGTRKAPKLLQQGVYPGGELSVTETMDEDNHLSLQFTDKRDLVVINRQLAKNDTLDTYYVYDDFGNLCFVLPPMAADSLKRKNIQETLDLYAFQYRYDDRNRCIGKKFPGCEWMEMIYDAADRLIFTQNGEQRKRGEWSITLSDRLGRSVIVGSYNGQPDRTAFEQKTVYTIFSPNSATAYYGYEIQGLVIDNNLKSLQIKYYDTYDYKRCLADFPVSLQYEKDASYGIRYGDDSDPSVCKGLLTGSVTSVLGSEQKLFSATYYDFYQRPVQVRSTAANDTTIVSKSSFNFVGQVTSSQQEYGASTTLNTHQVYDHVGRMTSETHRLNNDERSTSLFEYAYDELGRLSNVKKSNGKDYSFMTKNQYNIRSWLTQITSPQFKQTLHYTDGAGTPNYNGNISSMMWETDNLAGGYKFTYDGFSRLKDAIYGEGESLSTGTDDSTRCFSEQVGGYDKHGNILHLKRFGQTANNTYELIDDLTLNYNGNQLTSVNDSCYNSAYGNSFEFKDGIKQSVEYLYDANGDLMQDLNKKITNIEYNCLNLPSQIQFENGNSISYLYDALGNKHRVTYVIDGVTTATDYCGDAIYENGVLTKLLTNQGYITLADTTYHYFVQDHQGNNRVVVDQNGNVEEVNHYYPFGGTFSETANVQPYKYNGKELDTKNGLNWYDYGARMYDPAIGRWHVVDPMVETFSHWTPYNYCLNNPVKFIDKDGKLPIVLVPLIKGLIGGAMDLGVQVGLSMAQGNSFSKSIDHVDWTSVGASALTSSVGAVGSSTTVKLAAQTAIIATDAAVDISNSKGVEYSTLLGGKKEVAKSVIDAGASVIPGAVSNKVINGFEKAISTDLSSKGAATLTKETKSAMKDALKTVDGKAFKNGVDILNTTVGGTIDEIGKTIFEYQEEMKKLNKLK